MKNAKDILMETGKLALKVTPRVRHEGIEGFNEARELIVKVRAVPEDGKANMAVIKLLAEQWNIPASRLAIARGTAGRHKLLTLLKN